MGPKPPNEAVPQTTHRALRASPSAKITSAVEAKPLTAKKEEPVIGEPGSDRSEGEIAVLVVKRTPAKTKPAQFPRSKKPNPTTKPPRKKEKNKLLKEQTFNH